jgi:hypothetical protein
MIRILEELPISGEWLNIQSFIVARFSPDMNLPHKSLYLGAIAI